MMKFVQCLFITSTILVGQSLLIFVPVPVNAHEVAEEEYLTQTTDCKNVQLDELSDLLCCFANEGNPQYCLDTELPRLAEDHLSTQDLVLALQDSMKENSAIEQNCHVFAHAIGRYAYHTDGLQKAFHTVGPVCQSGGIHGVMERIFFSSEELKKGIHHLSFTDMVPRLIDTCTKTQFPDASDALLFQCAHGIGHTILYSNGYDIKSALNACDSLSSRLHQRSCAIGTFMEYVIGDGRDDRLDEKDPHRPCTDTPEKYKEDCYRELSNNLQYMLFTDSEMAEVCLKSEAAFRDECFEGLGRISTKGVRQGDPSRVLHMCEELSGDFRTDCIRGAAYVLTDLTWDASYALPFCHTLIDDSDKEHCISLTLSYLNGRYSMKRAKLLSQCNEYGNPEDPFCKETVDEISPALFPSFFKSIFRDVKGLLLLDF